MTQNFLDLMKKVAESYNIKIIENASKGGVFYRNENGELVELSAIENFLIMDNFSNLIKIDLESSESTYELNEVMNWAA